MDTAVKENAQQSGITVRVRFIGDLPAITGQRTRTVNLPKGATVASLFESLTQTYGKDFSLRLFSRPGKLHHTIFIFVDGEDYNERDGLAAKLGESSEVELLMLPVICGG
ncbi:MAG: hypothetical protein A3H91_17590 [Gammaproteobacteria bacterium RIFCSPLOWO2_02_FULL_61_13]|nr:MAG: hypothetical protein A3H91_17590 [Gammaproteobacteria bacterium RIFCSPLOWO2_02_FULL_61_13]